MNERLYYQRPSERTNLKKERRRNTLLTAFLFVIVMYYLIHISIDFWRDGLANGQVEYIRNEK